MTPGCFPFDYLQTRSFAIDDRFLFFDIFARNSQLIAIGPVYPDSFIDYSKVDFNISVDGGRVCLTQPSYQERILAVEGCALWFFDIPKDCLTIEITVSYLSVTRRYSIMHYSFSEKVSLAAAVLFSDDLRLLPTWLNWYINRGVSLFFLYSLPNFLDCLSLPESPTVKISWPFKYLWNDSGWHHAQVAQLNHMLYKFAKTSCDYVLNCDLDEYVTGNSDGDMDLIVRSKRITGAIRIENHWAHLEDFSVPEPDAHGFPETIYCDCVGSGRRWRTKYLYNSEDVSLLGVHRVERYLSGDCDQNETMHMFHFLNWSRRGRIVPPEPVKFTLLNISCREWLAAN